MPYQLVLLGPRAATKQQALTVAFEERMVDLGLVPGVDTQVLVSPDEDAIEWCGAPVAVWLGEPDAVNDPRELDLVGKLLDLPAPVFPVVEDLGHFPRAVPEKLSKFNGAQWLTADDLPKLVADLLRAMRLTRVQRQAFVSYKRDKTKGVARQLFSELGHRGYRPFLDTASVPLALDFQETLWAKMADIDLVILLDAPGTLDSNWVHQELNRAHALNLGVLQLVWPTPPGAASQFTGSKGTEFCDRFELSDGDFGPQGPWDAVGQADPAAQLDPNVVIGVLAEAEVTRLRSLNRRRKKVSGEVMDQAARHGLGVKQYPPDSKGYAIGAIGLLRGEKEVGCIIPLVGLPDAVVLHDHESVLNKPDWRQHLIAFDGLGISPAWVEHVKWLNQREKLVAKQVDELDEWMDKL